MKIAQIRQHDVANGPGVRVSFFVSGCTHNCFNCFNKEYQDFSFGEDWGEETQDRIIEYLKRDYIRGLSVLGGEPFQSPVDLKQALEEIRAEVNKDIWVWTGYNFEEIMEDKEHRLLLEEIDVLVDGRFVQRLKDLTLKFRGSSNQRIIDVDKSLQNDKVILYDI